jgi:uncharacterized protein (TIGR03437 family)
MLLKFAFCFALIALAAVGYAQTSFPPQQRLLSGSGFEHATAVTTDANGYIYVAGSTSSPDFPLLNATQTVHRGQALVVSFDSGASWRPANLSDPFIATLAVDPTDGFTVYAASGSTVYKTTDGGLRWIAHDVETFRGFGITLLAIDPQKPQTIYAAGQDRKIAKSDDGGITWKVLALPPPRFPNSTSVNTLDVDPFHSGVVYAASSQSTYVTYDGGDNWGKVLPPAGSDREFRVYFDQATQDVQYVFDDVLYKSTDAGQTWKPLNSPVLFFYGFSVDPVRAGYLYAQGDGKFFRSRDGGATWESFVNTTSGFPVADPNSNVIQAGLGRSIDGGMTWKPAPLSRSPSFLVYARSIPGLVYAVAIPSTSGFVAKLTPSLEIVFSTYLGGGGTTTPHAIVTDGTGDIYVAGDTYSVDFPVTPGALQRELGGLNDAFLAKLSGDGQLLWATYLGGRSTDSANAMAIDRDGSVIIAGGTSSPDFPAVPPTALTGAFVAKISPNGDHAAYVTGFGASGVVRGVAVDSDGSVVVAGDATNPTPGVFIPTADAAQPKSAGGIDAFLGRLDSSGRITYLTFWGGNSDENVAGLGLDADGNAYVAGTTISGGFPTTPGAYRRTLTFDCVYPRPFVKFAPYSDFQDGFVAKFDRAGKPVYSTLVGSSCFDAVTGMTVDAVGNAYVSGITNGGVFPLVNPAESAATYHLGKGFIARLDPTGSNLTFSSYSSTGAPAIALSPSGDVVTVGGLNTDINLPNLNPSHAHIEVIAAPQVAPLRLNGVGNAFLRVNGPVTAGEIVALPVDGIPDDLYFDFYINSATPLPTEVTGLRVIFDGQAAPLLSLHAGVVTAIAPQSLRGKTSTTIQAAYQGALSNPLIAEVRASDLGLYSANGSGIGDAYVQNQDGSTNSRDNPALTGSVITFFFTGAGENAPQVADGSITGDAATAVDASTFAMSNMKILDVLPVPGFIAGLYLVHGQLSDFAPSIVTLNDLGARGSTSQTLNIYVTRK